MAEAVEVGFDRRSREVIRALVDAVDGLAKALNNGEKVDNALISEPVVQRLVEDVTGRQTSDGQSLPDDRAYYRDADGRLRRAHDGKNG